MGGVQRLRQWGVRHHTPDTAVDETPANWTAGIRSIHCDYTQAPAADKECGDTMSTQPPGRHLPAPVVGSRPRTLEEQCLTSVPGD